MADDAARRAALELLGVDPSDDPVDAARAVLRRMRSVSVAGAGSTAASAPSPHTAGSQLLGLYRKWSAREQAEYEEIVQGIAAEQALKEGLAVIDELRRAQDLRRVRQVTKARKSAGKVAKAQQERRFTLGIAYRADTPDAFRGADGMWDFASAPVVEDAAWKFLRKGGKVGLGHRHGTSGAGEVVESYIYRGPDWKLGGQVVKAGDWLVGIRWNRAAWREIREGGVTGLSIQGGAQRRRPAPETLAALGRP